MRAKATHGSANGQMHDIAPHKCSLFRHPRVALRP
jgi:hypothetical protein